MLILRFTATSYLTFTYIHSYAHLNTHPKAINSLFLFLNFLSALKHFPYQIPLPTNMHSTVHFFFIFAIHF